MPLFGGREGHARGGRENEHRRVNGENDKKPKHELTLAELEALLAGNPRAQRMLTNILTWKEPPPEHYDRVREAVLREFKFTGVL